MTILAAAALAAALPRVFSADYCADQYVLALAEPAQIAALSVESAREFAHLRDEAASLPKARAGAEEIVRSDADLVIRFWGGDAARLERLGVKVLTLDYAADFDAVTSNIRKTAAALRRETEGRALVAAFEARLQSLAAAPPTGKSGLYVTPGAVTAGRGTMIDAIFDAAGLANIASAKGLSDWPPLPLEMLVLDPPPILVAAFFASESDRVDHWSSSRHPALRSVFNAADIIHLPTDLVACPAFFSAAAAEKIRAAIDSPHSEGATK